MIIVVSAILLSLLIYLFVGLSFRKKVVHLSDILPVMRGGNAKVRNSHEFSASTVATTISLATVIVAFFELAPQLGVWLFWPVATTALGLLFFSFFIKKIWNKLKSYENRPSLHEFLGTEFNSKSVAMVGAVFTTIGFLFAFAVELTVGGRFLAGLLPDIPQWITITAISLIAFIYTSLGGFRTVVVTDRIQMGFIWLLLLSLLLFYVVSADSQSWSLIPESVKSPQWSPALWSFVLGIFIMNLFTYISNMGLWQRISGSQDMKTVSKGMWNSAFYSALSWGLFVIVAIGAFTIVLPVDGENLLITLMQALQSTTFGKVIVFTVVLGLYGAMLSTASTQLIAISHTVYEDILAPIRKIKLKDRLESKKEVQLSRIILICAAFAAIILVEGLRLIGFSVADLAFSIYGAALSLVPVIIFSLLLSRQKLQYLRSWSIASVIIAFLTCWVATLYGNQNGLGNLVFLAPCISVGVASVIMGVGFFIQKRNF